MNNTKTHTHVIWRFSDNKAGHDSQSNGLVKALNHLQPFDCHTIDVKNNKPRFLDLVLSDYSALRNLPSPDLIIGAGHETHVPILCAKRARGGSSIVMMKPSLPNQWFDCCMIPEHDSPISASNIITTKGALNCIEPSTNHSPDKGLILVGGPSRHFTWNIEYLLEQLKEIIEHDNNVHWQISDSPRTPEGTSSALTTLENNNVDFLRHTETDKEWLSTQLNSTLNVWVSLDSVSMVYESLTSGAAVGLLDVPSKGDSKLSTNVAGLVEDNMVTPYAKWLAERTLTIPPIKLNEASRCAEYIFSSGYIK